MANSCKSTIQIKRGEDKDLPVLKNGELGFSTDTQEVYIGQENGVNLKLFPSEGGSQQIILKEIIGSSYNNPEKTVTNKRLLLPVSTKNVRTNAADYDQFFGLSTVSEISSHPAVTIKETGFYYFHFDLAIDVPTPASAYLRNIEVVGLTSYRAGGTNTSFIPLSHKMDVANEEGTIFLNAGTIVYVDVAKSSFPTGVPMFIVVSSLASAVTPEIELLKIQDFGFSAIKLNDQATKYFPVTLK